MNEKEQSSRQSKNEKEQSSRQSKNEKEQSSRQSKNEKEQSSRQSKNEKEQSSRQSKSVASLTVGFLLSVVSVFCPPAGELLSATSSLSGSVIKNIGQALDKEDIKTFGSVVEEGGAIGGYATNVSNAFQGKRHASTECKSCDFINDISEKLIGKKKSK